MIHDIVSIFTMLIVVAGITTVVANPQGTAAFLSNFFNGFNGSLRAAQGK